MSAVQPLQPQKYDFHYNYKKQIVEYSLWATSKDQLINTIIFLGTVQIDKHPQWIAEHSPLGTIVVQGAPHWLASDDESDTLEFMHRFTKEIFKTILDKYKIGELRIIVDSQASPGVLNWLTSSEHARSISQFVLLQPQGLNAEVYSGTDNERITLFKNRVVKNFRRQLRPLIFDHKLRYNHRLIIRTVGLSSAKIDAQYNSGLKYNSVNDLKKVISAGIRVTIICGKNDMIFPPQEIKDTLTKNNIHIPFITVAGVAHSPLATNNGMKLLVKALELLKHDSQQTTF